MEMGNVPKRQQPDHRKKNTSNEKKQQKNTSNEWKKLSYSRFGTGIFLRRR